MGGLYAGQRKCCGCIPVQQAFRWDKASGLEKFGASHHGGGIVKGRGYCSGKLPGYSGCSCNVGAVEKMRMPCGI